jgi:hypothetical protein
LNPQFHLGVVGPHAHVPIQVFVTFTQVFSLSFIHIINFVGLVESLFHGIISSRLYSIILNVIEKCGVHLYKVCMFFHGVGPPLAISNLLGKFHCFLLACTLLKPRVKD